MIMFAQYVQGSTFTKAVKMAEAVTDLAKRCAAADGDNPDCLKPLKQGSECWFKFSESWTVCSKTISLQSLSWHNSSYQRMTYHLCFRGQSDIHCSQSRRKEKERNYTFMQVRACWVNKSPQKAHKSKMECSHASPFFNFSQDKIFLDTICQEENLPRFTDCCAKKDPERNDCFLSLKNSSRAFISPFERPNAEAACKNYSQNQHSLTGYFIYEVSRRHPFLYAPTILSVAIHYDEMMKDCCRSAENPIHNLEECFRRQAPKVVKPVREDGLRQEHTCGILKKFGERTIKALKLAQISQKFPKADFVTVSKLVMDIANMHKDCCRGDMLECMHDREEILHYVCTNQDIISSKIKKCCEKPLLQRSECIINAENDDKPANLSPHVREFIEDKGTCERFAQEKDTHLARFLYEYSRRHPEFSAQMLLRIGKGYEDLLDECCKTGSPQDCCSRGEEELKKHIYETESVMKTSCDIYKEKGDYYFQNELLMSFTKKMPQLTSAELIKFTKQMTTIGSKCCQLSQDKLLPCAEENLDLVLGEICRRHLTNPINPGVCHCCSSSYALRRPCMGKLEIDENYVPLSLTPGLFTFHEDLCTTEEEKLQHKKQEMLINLIKYKPQITQEQLTSVTAAFTAMREQCCKEENHEACFEKEGPELIKRSEKMLSA
ncbi:LOW QUALITY PROTEIN: alpha-fetoprotein [Cygnus olor]|uniref:LOW QUALITY PROTEIN: alpha-fetoprotein n=1 Tax=Cygnus olor TaxID=8869 RepID=UPI001ADE2E3E|nr:LOW QUALITY PROTEIN: alpha-fetoprotein [Cygnus olor]